MHLSCSPVLISAIPFSVSCSLESVGAYTVSLEEAPPSFETNKIRYMQEGGPLEGGNEPDSRVYFEETTLPPAINKEVSDGQTKKPSSPDVVQAVHRQPPSTPPSRSHRVHEPRQRRPPSPPEPLQAAAPSPLVNDVPNKKETVAAPEAAEKAKPSRKETVSAGQGRQNMAADRQGDAPFEHGKHEAAPDDAKHKKPKTSQFLFIWEKLEKFIRLSHLVYAGSFLFGQKLHLVLGECSICPPFLHN